jgi:septum formation protein
MPRTPPLILASTSPARKALLIKAGLTFTVIPSPFDEETAQKSLSHLSIPEQAKYLAMKKAEAVSLLHPESLVLGADQMGEVLGKPLYKPLSHEAALKTLMSLSGKTHYQHTAASLFFQKKPLKDFFETTELTMKSMNKESLDGYLQKEQPYYCCGGYQYEGVGKALFHSVKGSSESIMGLPLQAILSYLSNCNIIGNNLT